MRVCTSTDGFTIRVGENAEENQNLCKQAKQNDIWFHLDAQPSPHVVLALGSGKQRKPAEWRASLHECQQLVKHFSSARESRQVGVIWIEAKWVSKNGVEDKVGSVSLKKSPQKANVVSDEGTVAELISRLSRE